MVQVYREFYIDYAQWSWLFDKKSLLGQDHTSDLLAGAEKIYETCLFPLLLARPVCVTRLRSGKPQDAVAIPSLGRGCASKPVSYLCQFCSPALKV